MGCFKPVNVLAFLLMFCNLHERHWQMLTPNHLNYNSWIWMIFFGGGGISYLHTWNFLKMSQLSQLFHFVIVISLTVLCSITHTRQAGRQHRQRSKQADKSMFVSRRISSTVGLYVWKQCQARPREAGEDGEGVAGGDFTDSVPSSKTTTII